MSDWNDGFLLKYFLYYILPFMVIGGATAYGAYYGAKKIINKFSKEKELSMSSEEWK